MPITDTKLKEIVSSFQQLATENFDNAKNTEQQNAVADALTLALKDFTRQFRLESGQDCPPGWTACPDGSCVPDGSGCEEGFDFLTARSFIERAASNYFSESQSQELQDRVGKLLQEAQESFAANVKAVSN